MAVFKGRRVFIANHSGLEICVIMTCSASGLSRRDLNSSVSASVNMALTDFLSTFVAMGNNDFLLVTPGLLITMMRIIVYPKG
jgi:hypothetical protein